MAYGLITWKNIKMLASLTMRVKYKCSEPYKLAIEVQFVY